LNSGHRPVTWHLHHSQDHQVSFAWYGGFFGWAARDLVNLGPETHQMFAWDESEKTVGSMTDMARRAISMRNGCFSSRLLTLKGL